MQSQVFCQYLQRQYPYDVDGFTCLPPIGNFDFHVVCRVPDA